MLDSLQNDSGFNKNLEEVNYWRGWAYIFSDEWEKAAANFFHNSIGLSISCFL